MIHRLDFDQTAKVSNGRQASAYFEWIGLAGCAWDEWSDALSHQRHLKAWNPRLEPLKQRLPASKANRACVCVVFSPAA